MAELAGTVATNYIRLFKLYQLSHQGSPRIQGWVAYPSPADLPDQGIEPGPAVLQVDSLPAELPGSPKFKLYSFKLNTIKNLIFLSCHISSARCGWWLPLDSEDSRTLLSSLKILPDGAILTTNPSCPAQPNSHGQRGGLTGGSGIMSTSIILNFFPDNTPRESYLFNNCI